MKICSLNNEIIGEESFIFSRIRIESNRKKPVWPLLPLPPCLIWKLETWNASFIEISFSSSSPPFFFFFFFRYSIDPRSEEAITFRFSVIKHLERNLLFDRVDISFFKECRKSLGSLCRGEERRGALSLLIL